MHNENLTDDQIDELLGKAHARLSGKEHRESAALSLGTPAKQLVSASKLNFTPIAEPYVVQRAGIARADTHRLLSDRERQLCSRARRVEDPISSRKKHIESKKATAGAEWFDLPRTILTPELKRDLQLLKMRSVLDPKRHYKKESATAKAPEFSQVGTIVEGPTEFYSARLQNKDRKRTFVEEVMVGESSTGRFKTKYHEVQAVKTSGKKAHYNALKAKRSRALRS
ncbi:hypothetical protein MMC13_001491 [Lambiella insularis]|nr:hypothetical protein [Lambiella insularis]